MPEKHPITTFFEPTAGLQSGLVQPRRDLFYYIWDWIVYLKSLWHSSTDIIYHIRYVLDYCSVLEWFSNEIPSHSPQSAHIFGRQLLAPQCTQLPFHAKISSKTGSHGPIFAHIPPQHSHLVTKCTLMWGGRLYVPSGSHFLFFSQRCSVLRKVQHLPYFGWHGVKSYWN